MRTNAPFTLPLRCALCQGEVTLPNDRQAAQSAQRPAIVGVSVCSEKERRDLTVQNRLGGERAQASGRRVSASPGLSSASSSPRRSRYSKPFESPFCPHSASIFVSTDPLRHVCGIAWWVGPRISNCAGRLQLPGLGPRLHHHARPCGPKTFFNPPASSPPRDPFSRATTGPEHGKSKTRKLARRGVRKVRDDVFGHGGLTFQSLAARPAGCFNYRDLALARRIKLRYESQPAPSCTARNGSGRRSLPTCSVSANRPAMTITSCSSRQHFSGRASTRGPWPRRYPQRLIRLLAVRMPP